MTAPRLELDVLKAVAAAEKGAAFGEIRDQFKGVPVTRVLDRLVDRGQVERFPGLVFHVTPFGRSRLEG